MYIFFEIKDTRCCITIHSFNISGYRTVYIKKKKKHCQTIVQWQWKWSKSKMNATNSMMSYIKCSLPYFDPCSLLKIRFYLNVMLDKLISYIVCLYKIIYQVEPVVWTSITRTGLDINVCPVPVKTDVGQVKKSDSQTFRYDGQIYFHWYKILGLLYKRAQFDLQFVHNSFWLKLKWNA